MHDVDLVVIRNFIAVVETGSLTLAATRVGRTAGALSYQICRLETALGQKLFIRNGRGMTPSKDGDQFLVQARSLLQVYDQALDKKNLKHLPAVNRISRRKKIDARESFGGSGTNQIDCFEDKLGTQLLKDAFSMWQSYRADGKELSLDDLRNSGKISHLRHNAFLVDSRDSEFRCIWASEVPKRLFNLDKYGFGLTLEQIWKNTEIFQSRRKIFSICKEADVPIFYSGNAPLPLHSDHYHRTIRQFVATRLDRLLLPVKIKSENGSHAGILQIVQFRDGLTLPKQKTYGMSVEERATRLNMLGNFCVAL